ncbi:putative cAMP-specific phosphodiesterase [Neospora caninum Liverpool]|uniref:Putative cAMP-specific phosphodiesterase n=1 Tax=Neospora caninum (strain Liverpool) TaxID=572307 RepID=F0VH18_NEOCL|nr:putative cAMP-specific phosphodiesterase [Neospora caninum Liverpool]CBZ53012.1 putative cAMP-specific phosphodiesterase [Neospora caninum Liverpool]CEL66996.1 TPA: cAMP-specific phosphodiesterase, putative [Neospora caninum Liverpool]|eukprot:XP_003883044.1 putative cAMP-specific phosphodiesterase [Neospora caninum Liverpool]
MVDVATTLRNRTDCLMTCTQENFPEGGCEEELDRTIEYRGNKYTRFFSFPAPEGVTQSKYSGDYFESYTRCEDMALDPSGALWRQFASQSYRQLIIQQNYTKVCEIFRTSADFCDNHEDRLHTCFLGCRRPEDTAATGYTMDNRPPCVSGEETRPPLLCIYPDDIAKDTFFDKMVGSTCIYAHAISADKDSSVSSAFAPPIWCFGALQLFGAIFAANFLQLVFEILLLRVLDMADKFIEQSLALRSRKCLYISLISVILGVAVFVSLGAVTILRRVGLETALVISFFLALAVDQVKFFLVQPIIWWVLLRRCGKLSPAGVQEYDDDYLTLFQAETSLVDTARKAVGDFMSTIVFQRVLLSFLLAYTAFLLIEFLLLNNVPDYNLVVVPNIDQGRVIARQIDNVFTVIFALEVLGKFVGYGLIYLKDPIESFDTLVVMTTFTLLILGFYVSGIGLLRILRLLSALALLHKYPDSRERRPEWSANNSSKLEKASSIVEGLLTNVHIPKYFKTELDWVWDSILSNKVYDTHVENEEEEEDQATEASFRLSLFTEKSTIIASADASRKTQAAVRASRAQSRASKVPHGSSSMVIGSTNGRISGQMLENLREPDPRMMDAALYRSDTRNLDPLTATVGGMKSAPSMFTKGSKSSTMMGSSASKSFRTERNKKSIDILAVLYQASQITGAEQEQVNEAMRPFDEWQWDALHASDVCDMNLLPVVFVRAIATFPTIMTKFNFDLDRLFDFLKVVQTSFQKNVKFHCAAHTADMIQAMHYFLTIGKLGTLLSEYDVFLCHFCALVCHFGHPGVSNTFLVKSRHPRAIRYDDESVNENYVASTISCLVARDEYNFFGDMMPLWQVFRLHMIDILLNFDISKSARQVAMFRTKVSIKFTAATPADKQLLLTILLRASDYSFTCRQLAVYSKWKDRMIDEFFAMGDTEKQLALTVSPFCDRELTNVDKCHVAFVEVAVKPLMTVLVLGLAPHLQKDVLDTLEANQKNLMQKLDKND